MKITVPSRFLLLFMPFVFNHANATLVWYDKAVSVQAVRGAQEDVRATFKFKNTAPKRVTILGITTSCGCTVANAESSTVAAGETSDIYALFTIGNRHGRQEKKITVSTDDSENPETILTFTIDLLEPPAEAHAPPVASHR